MTDRKHMALSLLTLVLALTLLVPAMAEDVLESAPEVVLAEETPAEETPEKAAEPADETITKDIFWHDPYLPDIIVPNHDEAVQNEEWIYIDPGLTLAEYNRIKELMAAVEEGKVSLSDISYPEHPSEVKIGVYPVNPADFNGETYFVTLPSRKLKDNDLLYLLYCFDRLGIPFDPDALYSRNCMRGYLNYGTNRELSKDESVRMESFKHQVARGMLTEADVHPETECVIIRTWFGPITLYPYRKMTDDELATFALARETVWAISPDEVEKAARDFVSGIFNMPLSMKLTDTQRSLIPYSDTEEGYGLTFTIEYIDDQGKTQAANGRPASVYVYLRRRMDYDAVVGDTAIVYYYGDYTEVFQRQEGEALSKEELLETGKKWILENCNLPGIETDFAFTIADDYNVIRVWAENWTWALFVELTRDGFVENFSAQRLF